MEIIDLYYDDHQRTGKSMDRAAGWPKEGKFLVVHLFVFNSEGEMLIQQRQFTKKMYPGKWDVSAGGFAQSGESAKESILREAAEEIGLKLEAETVNYALTAGMKYALDVFFYTVTDVDASTLPLQEEEVAALKWVSEDELFSMLDTGEFIDFGRGLLTHMFDLAKGRWKP